MGLAVQMSLLYQKGDSDELRDAEETQECSLRRVPANQPPQREQDAVHGWPSLLGTRPWSQGVRWWWCDPWWGNTTLGRLPKTQICVRKDLHLFYPTLIQGSGPLNYPCFEDGPSASVSLSSAWWVEAETVLALWHCGREMRPMYGDVRKALQTHSSSEFKCAFMSRTINV